MLISYMYVCTCEICIWIYVPTCRNKCNWCTLKHIVLVRIKGLQKTPKIPGNAFSDALLKSRFQKFTADDTKKKNRALPGFLGGNHGKEWCAPAVIFCQERYTLKILPSKIIIRMDRNWFWVARSNFGVKGPPRVCLPRALLNSEFSLHVLIWLSKRISPFHR